jgi:hypothetical protein
LTQIEPPPRASETSAVVHRWPAIVLSALLAACGGATARLEVAPLPTDEELRSGVAAPPAPLEGDGRATIPALVGTFDAAASGRTIAVAWTSHDGPQDRSPVVEIALFDAQLRRVASAAAAPAGQPTSLSIAPAPSGWMLALGMPASVSLVPLAPDGTPGAELLALAGAGTPRLVEVPGAMPLLVHTVDGTITVAQLRRDGTIGWTSTAFSSPSTEPELGSAVFVGDAVLVASRTGSGVSVARVELLDGRVTRVTQPGSGSTEYPQIAWDGGEATLTWSDFGRDPSVWWARLDRSGAVVGTPVRLAGQTHFNRVPLAPSRAGTTALLSGYTGGTERASSLVVAEVDHHGRMGPERAVDAGNVVRGWRLVRSDAGLFAAWITNPAGEFWAPQGAAITIQRVRF